VLDVSRARALGFEPQISLEDGIREVIAWYRNNREAATRRYNVFTEKSLVTSRAN
jgi:dTDP-D-glucose 4,6-dehydratase